MLEIWCRTQTCDLVLLHDEDNVTWSKVPDLQLLSGPNGEGWFHNCITAVYIFLHKNSHLNCKCRAREEVSIQSKVRVRSVTITPGGEIVYSTVVFKVNDEYQPAIQVIIERIVSLSHGFLINCNYRKLSGLSVSLSQLWSFFIVRRKLLHS